MSIQDYITKREELQKTFIDFLDDQETILLKSHDLMISINDPDISEDKYELKALCYLICKISNNHHRTPLFHNKIDQILQLIEPKIKKFLTNKEIFRIFKTNKRILLFLIKEKLLTIDKSIVQTMKKEKYQRAKYFYFFYPEIKTFIDEKQRDEIENEVNKTSKNNPCLFEDMRTKAENPEPICEIIRNDSIDDFVSYLTLHTNSKNMIIEPSIFETNPFLYNRELTLLEYSTFFGSIQIFKFLLLNGARLTPSLWIFAIHGQNPDIIHLLEEKKIQPLDCSFKECLKESIKCHYVNITSYILNSISDGYQIDDLDFSSLIIDNHNYSYFPTDLENPSIFLDLCKYNYVNLVKLLLKTKKIDVNQSVIHTNYNFHEIPRFLFSIKFQNDFFESNSIVK
ncbi:hypothetical protein M9Y10_045157 [Tritrichomonas musculus]|uniref:DUF3447 domain-containing protein n=1 Tax=Tritrichomonas musculus TaxID=1915356 RepID=A0ABR2JXF2_9EUKA